jgi:hypothetical protein
MSDARWNEVDGDVRSAVRHFSMAVRLHEKRDRCKDEFETYQVDMALMHAMQSGHTSFEKAMMRILDMLQEERPSGESWHRDLVNRVSSALGDRPAILDSDLERAANETRSFRNLATRGYDTFSLERCEPAISAARVLVRGIPEAVSEFRRLVDPPANDTRDPGAKWDGDDGPPP